MSFTTIHTWSASVIYGKEYFTSQRIELVTYGLRFIWYTSQSNKTSFCTLYTCNFSIDYNFWQCFKLLSLYISITERRKRCQVGQGIKSETSHTIGKCSTQLSYPDHYITSLLFLSFPTVTRGESQLNSLRYFIWLAIASPWLWITTLATKLHQEWEKCKS